MSALDDFASALLSPALPKDAQVQDPVGTFLKGWGKDRVEDIGTNFGIRTPGNLRDPYIRAQEAAKNGNLDDLQQALKEAGPGKTSEEIRTLSGLRQQAEGMASQRADQRFNKQADRLYGNNGLITNLETRRAAQQLASQKILGQLQSQTQLASQQLANQGAMNTAAIGAAAGLKNTDMAGMWGFKNTLANNASAEKLADMTSGRSLVANLQQTNAQREANLLANQTARAGQVMNAYTQNLGTTAGALASAFNSRSSFK